MASLAEPRVEAARLSVFSAPVLRGLAQAADVLTLICAAPLAAAAAAVAFDGPTRLAGLVGAAAAAALLSAQDAYAIERLRRPGAQAGAILRAGALAGVAAALCLFLAGASGQIGRAHV